MQVLLLCREVNPQVIRTPRLISRILDLDLRNTPVDIPTPPAIPNMADILFKPPPPPSPI